MAFESLTEKLQSVFQKLGARGRLTEHDIKEAMREVRMALLEADVNYRVVKDFIQKVSERAAGQDVLASLTPGQQVIKIVNEELIALMGGGNARIQYASRPPTVIVLCGLQGAGKTTFAAKLGGYFVKQGKKPLLAACDIYRPAAIDQLKVMGERVNVPVYEKGTQNPVKTAEEAIEHARYYGLDPVIIDTAGRLNIDEAMMAELKAVVAAVKPQEVLLTVDAMIGQEAVTIAKSFDEQLEITGILLTKLDGDTRGGAALSVRAVTGKPIKFAGTSERVDGIELFHPERMASRILGMGDMLSLIEKAQEQFDEKKAQELEKKMRRQELTLEDYLEQFQQVKKMGGIHSMLKMLPGANKISESDIDEKQMGRVEAIIRAMTPAERQNPGILNASRRKRIAAGSGTKVEDINRLMKQFEQTQQMMKQFSSGRFGRKGRGVPFS